MNKRKELLEVVYEQAKSGDGEHLAEALAAYLIAERRTKEVSALLRDLENLRLSRDGILEISVTSAHRLDDATRTAIKNLFEAKQVIIHEQQDPSILGGVKVRAHDKSLDYSVRTRLQRLRAGA
jgi:F-type H+-transporting ATPase subunit delta